MIFLNHHILSILERIVAYKSNYEGCLGLFPMKQERKTSIEAISILNCMTFNTSPQFTSPSVNQDINYNNKTKQQGIKVFIFFLGTETIL